LLRESYSAIQDQRNGDDAARKSTTLATQGLNTFLRYTNSIQDQQNQIRDQHDGRHPRDGKH
jgi:hypothetical protein